MGRAERRHPSRRARDYSPHVPPHPRYLGKFSGLAIRCRALLVQPERRGRSSTNATGALKPLHLPPASATDGKGIAVHFIVVASVVIGPCISQLTRCGSRVFLCVAGVGGGVVVAFLACSVGWDCKHEREAD